MARFTKAFQKDSIKGIAAVSDGFPVMHLLRSFRAADCLAALAQRIHAQFDPPHFPPPWACIQPVEGIVFPFSVVFPPLLDPVSLASAVAGGDQDGATRVAAGMLRSRRAHLVCLALTRDVNTGCLRVSIGCSLTGAFPLLMT